MFKLHNLIFLAVSLPAFAVFDKDHPSINNTANTLPKEQVEVGFGSVEYGLTDELTIGASTLPTFSGNVSLMASYQFKIQDKFKIKPQASLNYDPKYIGFYSIFGASFGLNSENKHHDFTITGTFLKLPSSELFSTSTYTNSKDILKTIEDLLLPENWKYTLIPSFNYDYYTEKGNIFFAGLYSIYSYILPYYGFTFASDSTWHLGVGAVSYLPFIYTYWRF